MKTFSTNAAALKFLRKAMKRYGAPDQDVTDELPSCKAALRNLGSPGLQAIGRWLCNRAENSYQPLRRREKVMNRSRSMRNLHKFAAVQSPVHNQFKLERHVYRREDFKENGTQALAVRRRLAA
ncbi:DDE-type integrase/transposase/recombinase [Maricaulis alexandrii]|uniref:DDE-type integrase/transposase/recombinase n=1 Tax=Maricaulis alexandrii TaxID=2570354 RepID=UPI001F19ABB9|nr:DDE-type integrase/transposase/recombinase [Maricaulis alexandrii]